MTGFQEEDLSLRRKAGAVLPDPSCYEGMDIRNFAMTRPRAVSPEEQLQKAVEEDRARCRRVEEEAGLAAKALLQAAGELKKQSSEWQEQARDDMSRLALYLAEKIVETELRLRPELVVAEVKKVLEEGSAETSRTLHLHPEDLQYLQEHQQDFLKSLNGDGGMAVKPDESLQRGSCRLDTPMRRFESSLMKRLEFVRDELGGKQA